MNNLCCALASTLSLLTACDALAEGWDSFQNGGRLTVEQDAELAISWGPEDVTWRAELKGYGQSSPVTDGRTLYVTSVSGDMKDQLHVQAIDPRTGAELWRHDTVNSTPEQNNNYVSRAAPTPVCDAQGVVAFFEGGNVVALTAEGELRWQRDLVADYGKISARHGLAASLEQNDKQVFVWVERQEEPYLLALDKTTGETVWKAAGVGATSWSSPRLVPVGDSQHLVASAIGTVAGYDPNSGKRLWALEGVVGNSAPTPVPLGDGRFLLGATTGRGGVGSGAAAGSNGVVQIEPLPAGGFKAEYAWRAKRATSSFGSPVAHRGHAYFVNRSGVVYCLDLETGEERYAKRAGGSVWATPIAVGDRLYLLGKDGSAAVINAGPEFEVLAENSLWASDNAADGSPPGRPTFGGPVLYAVLIANDCLLMRRGDRLYCVAAKPQ